MELCFTESECVGCTEFIPNNEEYNPKEISPDDCIYYDDICGMCEILEEKEMEEEKKLLKKCEGKCTEFAPNSYKDPNSVKSCIYYEGGMCDLEIQTKY